MCARIQLMQMVITFRAINYSKCEFLCINFGTSEQWNKKAQSKAIHHWKYLNLLSGRKIFTLWFTAFHGSLQQKRAVLSPKDEATNKYIHP